jgi:YVTN family beta-propeller protein
MRLTRRGERVWCLLWIGILTVVAAIAWDGPAAPAEAVAHAPTAANAAAKPLPASPGALRHKTQITGRISPKSIVAGPRGLFFAQNMMYTHTITVYDSHYDLVKTISDAVDLANFGISGHPGTTQGAPVEAAFTPDGKHVYVSNYAMYGDGFSAEPSDQCTPNDDISRSYVYRIDTATLEIDQVIPAGKVPKFLAVSPDGEHLVVSNWCSYTASIIDTDTGTTAREVEIGPYPRGVVIDPTSTTAYVAVMGSTRIAAVTLADGAIRWIDDVGAGPRHVNLSPEGGFLYVTCNKSDDVAKIDAASGAVTARISTGDQPRSAALGADGKHLYVVNYGSATVSVVDTATMEVAQSISVGAQPIGITYDQATGQVWVALYSGAIEVFEPADAAPAA